MGSEEKEQRPRSWFWGVLSAIIVLIGCFIILAMLPAEVSGYPIPIIESFKWLLVSLGIIFSLASLWVVKSPVQVIYVVGGMMLLFSLVTGLYTRYIVPSELKNSPLPDQVKTFFLAIGVPSDWLFMPAILYLFFIPFLTLFGIVEGVMRNLEKVFGNWTHVIAFGIAFLCIPTQILTLVVQGLFATLGAIALYVFVILFIAAAFGTLAEGFHATGLTASESIRGLIREAELETEFDEKIKKLRELAKNVIPTSGLDKKTRTSLFNEAEKGWVSAYEEWEKGNLIKALSILDKTIVEINKTIEKKGKK